MKTLRFFGMALLAIFLCVSFAACSDEDDAAVDDTIVEQESSNSIIGIWTESWYNDIIEIKADGSGYWAERLGDTDINTFSWSYSDGFVYIIEESDFEEAKMVSQTDDKIVWKHYVDNPNSYDPKVIKKDDYGYYYVWVWERYTE